MQIAWNGLGSFEISAKTGQGDVTVVTNPFASGEVKFPRSLAASIVVSSHEGKDASSMDAITAEYPEDKRCPFVIGHAGEFEVRGIAVTGVYAPKKDGDAHTVYRIDAESIGIGFLGGLDRALTDKEVEALGNIDVLIVPSASATVAAENVAKVEPRLVIPSYVDDTAAICRELGCSNEAMAKLKLTRAALPEEDMKIVTLTRG